MRWEVAAGVAVLAVIVGGVLFMALSGERQDSVAVQPRGGELVSLPPPARAGEVSFEVALDSRQSVRMFSPDPLTLTELSQLLWAAQGLTRPGGFRTTPSAGALYPLEIRVVAGNVEGLMPGVYQYHPSGHHLALIGKGDLREDLSGAGLGQSAIRDAPATLVISAVPSRPTGKYGGRGVRYVHMEAGHASQNIYLQAASRGLGTVAIGAFHDDQVREILLMDTGEEPLYLMPVGHPPLVLLV
jgi:SagB-type dehydrogenase family enzyme